MRNLAKKILENSGYSPIFAIDGDDGVKQFKANRDHVKCIILDMNMPVKSGLEAFY